MDYREGARYLLRNVVTGEGTYFDAEEVLFHRHNTIMYGRLMPWEIHIYRGHFEQRGRPTVIPIPGMNHGRESLMALAMCIAATGGDTNDGAMPFGKHRLAPIPPWVDVGATPYKRPHSDYPEEPVYTYDRETAAMWGGTPFKESNCLVCRGWGGSCQGHTPNRDGLVRAAILALDLFDDVLRQGHIPQDFVNKRQAYLLKRELEVRGMAN